MTNYQVAFPVFVCYSCATPVETMDTVDTMDGSLAYLWTQWTEKYAVDTSALEWGARGRRFESSRPD